MLASCRLAFLGSFVCLPSLFVVISEANVQGQQPTPTSSTKNTSPLVTSAAGETLQDVPVTTADRIARLQSTIAADELALNELRSQLAMRASEEEDAGTEFQQVTAQIESLNEELRKVKDDATASTQTDEKLRLLQTERALAKEKFDLAIAARKTAQERITTLEAKTVQDKQALDKLKGIGPPPVETEQPAPMTSTVPEAGQPAPPIAGGASQLETTKNAEKKKTPETKAEREARRDVEKKEKALADLEQDLEKLAETKSLLEQNITLESQTLETSRKQYDNLAKELDTAEIAFGERLAAGALADELQQLRQRVSETRQQMSVSRSAIRQSTDRLATLRNQLLTLQNEETALVKQTDELRRQAEAAKRSEFFVKVQQYIVVTGPKVLATMIVMFILWTFVKLVCARAKKWIERDAAGTKAERKHRSQTLIGVFQNTGNLAIVVGGVLMMLDAAGVPIAPLLGGAGVVGLAVAFAAQSLIKDYFCGFILLLENQFRLGDVITINDMTGTVERITLRITVLRNTDGHVFYVPNGQITAVKNSTTDWARVVLDVGVAYKEQIDQVIDVLMEIATEFQMDADNSEIVLGAPEMFGVDALADSSVVVRLGIRVRPDKQWAVRRELLRRIKSRFDELGIEIPFPQQTVHHRMQEGEAVPSRPQHSAGEHPN